MSVSQGAFEVVLYEVVTTIDKNLHSGNCSIGDRANLIAARSALMRVKRAAVDGAGVEKTVENLDIALKRLGRAGVGGAQTVECIFDLMDYVERNQPR